MTLDEDQILIDGMEDYVHMKSNTIHVICNDFPAAPPGLTALIHSLTGAYAPAYMPWPLAGPIIENASVVHDITIEFIWRMHL